MNRANFTGTPTKPLVLNQLSFSPDEVGTVTGQVDYPKVAPYIGVGWGNPYTRRRFKFMLDMGVFSQPEPPTVKLHSTGMLEPFAEQWPIMQYNLRVLKLYPILILGVSYKL